MSLTQTWKNSIKRYPSLSQQEKNPSLNLNIVRGILEAFLVAAAGLRQAVGIFPVLFRTIDLRLHSLSCLLTRQCCHSCSVCVQTEEHFFTLGHPFQDWKYGSSMGHITPISCVSCLICSDWSTNTVNRPANMQTSPRVSLLSYKDWLELCISYRWHK